MKADVHDRPLLAELCRQPTQDRGCL